MDIKQVTPTLKLYLKKVNEHVSISRALVFGSFAEGKATERSDIDLLVLSDDFSKLNDIERSKLLYRSSVGFPYDLHVYGVTPEEFIKASPLTTLGSIRESKIIPV